jgi:archaellum component FlaC
MPEITKQEIKEAVKEGIVEAFEPFATAIKQDFDVIDTKLDKIDKKIVSIDSRLENLEMGVEDIKLRLDQVAYRFEVQDLDRRLKLIEGKLGIKQPSAPPV